MKFNSVPEARAGLRLFCLSHSVGPPSLSTNGRRKAPRGSEMNVTPSRGFPPNSIQRTGASLFGEAQMQCQGRLAPSADRERRFNMHHANTSKS